LGLGTLLKLGPILALCFAGLFANGMPSEFVLPEFSQGEAVILLLAYAFSGAGMVTLAAGETKEPRSVISNSIYLNLAIVGIFYALVQLAYISISPDPDETDSPLAAAASALFGPFGALIISLAAIFSIGANQLNSFVTMPRVAFGMGRRGLLPSAFAYVSPRFKTPVFAIAIYSLIVAGLSVSGTFEVLAILVVAVEQLTGYAVIASLVVMWRRNDGGIADKMDLRWAAIVPVSIGFMAWFTLQVPLDAMLSTTILVVIGIVLYWLSKTGAVEHEAVVLPERRA
jgi:amino acid transporter